jgi:IclR family transcriptional regulator, acetate operon repressor
MMFTMKDSVQLVEQPRPSSPVPSVAAACRILDALAAPGRDGATLSELARELELSKSSAHGLLRTLQAWGMVQRESESRRFRLGATLVALGQAAAGQLRAAPLVGERLAPLAGEHELTFAVAQVTGSGDAQIIDRAYPPSDVHVGVALGSRYGPFDGAIGKCLLAAMDPSAAAELVRSADIPRHTGRTLVKPDALLADIDRVRRQGWAVSAGELKDNHAVAAPMFDVHGDVELIVFAVGFPGQLPSRAMPRIGEILRETAHAVATALGAGRSRARDSGAHTPSAEEA